MKLWCQKAFLILAVSAIGCSDPSGPRSVAGVYLLESVNDQPLPAPLGENAISVIYGSVILTEDANATTVERRRDARQNVPTEFTLVSNYRYQLDGRWIDFIFDCPPHANCITIEGMITDDVLTIAIGGFAASFLTVYKYRLAPNLGPYDRILVAN